jgi:hypothetical protein
MIDHAFKPHEVWKDRDSCEERIDSGDGSGMTSACTMPRRAHPTAEALRIAELEAALRKYGCHDIDVCDGEETCSCGLTAALAGKEG